MHRILFIYQIATMRSSYSDTALIIRFCNALYLVDRQIESCLLHSSGNIFPEGKQAISPSKQPIQRLPSLSTKD